MNIQADKWYRTRDGRKARVHALVLKNSAGRYVTYPVKGLLYTQGKSGKWKSAYAIWSIDGRFSVLEESGRDLIEEMEEQKL